MIPERRLRGLELVAAVKKHLSGWDEFGVPWLNKKEIEDIANLVLARLDPTALQHPAQTQVAAMLDYLRHKHGTEIIFGNLGEKDGHRILGKVIFSRNTICIDEDLVRDHPAYRFTVAHEIGHWLLHRWKPIFRKKPSEPLYESEDTEQELFKRTGTRLPTSPLSLIEAHAHHFAACLVMPRITLWNSLMTKQVELGISRNLGLIYLNSDTRSQSDFTQTINHLCATFGVSKQALIIRLKRLAILSADPQCAHQLFPAH